MAKDTYFITTAIDYTNSAPHIGHAYEKLLADVIARYQRSQGKKVYFLTGVDQHGQKVQQSAAKVGLEPAEFAELNTAKFLDLWRDLGISYDGWAATTAPVHKRVVQVILQDLHDQGQLYNAAHRGMYSVRQEQFLTDKDRNESGEFGEEWGEVVEIAEENWYFKLSEHIPWLKSFLAQRPEIIFPSFRGREVVNALERSEAGDLCITRPKSRLAWGIELPFDRDFVTYVWFDALINYVSFAGYRKDPTDTQLPDFQSLWPPDVELIGKDIMVPAHAVYWYAMLHALGFDDNEMPRLVVHGFWNDKGGAKISKSGGNIIDPRRTLERYGVDTLRYYLMASIATGQDADFSDERVDQVYNKDLANDLGNLLNRSLNMARRYRPDGLSAKSDYDDELNRELRESITSLPGAVASAMETFQVHLALEEVWRRVVLCNQFVERAAPWKLAKNADETPRLNSVLYHLAEALSHIAIHLAPVLPGTSERILAQLAFDSGKAQKLSWGLLPDGHKLGEPTVLFPRLET